jgi:lipoate-protein ligase A
MADAGWQITNTGADSTACSIAGSTVRSISDPIQGCDCRSQSVRRSASFPSASSLIPSTIRLLVDPPAAGSWNMAVDQAILEAADHGRCTLRFYQWEAPTLSFGYFQTYADRWQHEASRSCATVRRSSGGGAILHDLELTYSLAMTANHAATSNRLALYQAVHSALIDTLTDWGIHATLCTPIANDSPTKEPFLCFQRRSAGDVLFQGVKIAGSAQRRYGGAVLQHGSILLRQSLAAPELPGILDISGKSVEPQELMTAWLARLVKPSSIDIQAESLPEEQRLRALELVETKYDNISWTEHRGRL